MAYMAKPIGGQTHSFQTYPTTQISRSRFNRSHSRYTTMQTDYLYPIWFDEALPGDTLEVSMSAFCRLTTQLVPFMDNVYMDIHFWKVPYRLVWDHWVNFQGEEETPGVFPDYLTPVLKAPATGVEFGSIFDYFRVPPKVGNLEFNAFNFRAYNLVYNEWYRDENLIDRVEVEKGDTTENEINNYKLLKRGKRKDYFTSALPWPQKGPAVDIPLGTTAPVYGDGKAIQFLKGTALTPVQLTTGNGGDGQYMSTHAYTGALNTTGGQGGKASLALATSSVGNSGLYADLTDATAATINTLRQAFALQRMYEIDARGGTRYIEMILAHFGVQSPDARLQRPEFLGGGTFDLHLNVVPQTSSTDTASPQGNLASYGVINGRTKKIVTSFTEHSLVFAVASVRADLTYQQGLPRQYSRRARTDFYLPALANLGEQAILNKEIFAQGTDEDNNVFGYQERWAEYRYKQNEITGYMRSDAVDEKGNPASLDYWHLAQDFNNLPKLNQEFINEAVPINRVLAMDSSEVTPPFICNFYFNEYWTRPLPVYSIPSMKGHF
ncbi:MAG: major capsid protein [Chaetfec virus UA24_2340]|nr:MAG: major capsid protein [Chaetfec virus UA24_2340]